MRQSELFVKTSKTPPKDEESTNARLLEQAGFVHKLMSGVYSFLPLGLRVLNKIENIIREEINAIGGKEILMPALHPKENWEKTRRWNSFDALFKLKSRLGSDYALGATHEEVIFPLLVHHISSYKDLPFFVYQIQTKFRDETRAKSGLLRGREFRMKDLYSFHETEGERNQYYEKVKEAYEKIFSRIGINALPTDAGGGTFSDLSMEFQVPTSAGEDNILVCEKCNYAKNNDIAKNYKKCAKCGGKISNKKSIEVGNIFPLKTQFAEDFNLKFKDRDGKSQLVSAGCYGIGTSRILGAVVEVTHDEKGIIWPASIAPFKVHLIDLYSKIETDKIYDMLLKHGVEVLFDNREESTPGEKFIDADLIGIPFRIVVSKKTLAKNSLEIKKRNEKDAKLIKIPDFSSFIKEILQ